MTPDYKNKTCIIAARVSSKDQEVEGYSLPSQSKLLTEYANRLGFITKHEFEISETASKREQRTKFNKMMKIAKEENIDALIFEKVDRVTRNLHSSVDIYNWLETDENRTVHCVKDSLILHKNSKSQDKLSWDMKVAMAKNYADNLSEEVIKGKKEKIDQGVYPGSASVGYKSVDGFGTKKKIQIVDEDTAPFVKKAFELFATGDFSIEKLTEKMNIEGMRNKQGRTFVKSRMHELLRNPFYYGGFRWNNKIYSKGRHEPIITKELFDRVQGALTRKPDSKYSKHFYMLKGMVSCGECSGSISWYKKKGHVYGRCNHHRECSQSSCGREDQCDEVIQNALQSLKVQSPRFQEWIKKSLKEDNKEQEAYLYTSLDALNTQLKQVVEKQSRLYDDRLDEIIDLAKYKTKNSELEGENEQIEEQIKKINEDSNKYFQVGTLVDLVAQYADQIYDILDPEEISGIMKYIFGDITLLDGKMQYKYTEPFKVLKKVVDITNESSKALENAKVAENIFEPLITIEKTMQSELVEAVRTEVRRAFEKIRTDFAQNL